MNRVNELRLVESALQQMINAGTMERDVAEKAKKLAAALRRAIAQQDIKKARKCVGDMARLFLRAQ